MASPSIFALTPDRLQDFLTFMDGPAFADNPDWAGCYCRLHCFEQPLATWTDATPAGNREAVVKRILEGTYSGFMAYQGDQVIGWVQAGPVTSLTRLPELLEDQCPPMQPRIGAVTCFVIAAPYRRQGVARYLLAAALDDFQNRGFERVEAYPKVHVDGSDGEAFCGPESLFLQAGFQLEGEGRRRRVYRRTLTPSLVV